MSLKGIDIASYQTGLDPAVVPGDFVIVKATQGTGYVNPDFTRAAEATLAAGKLLGVYHYASGGDPQDEAAYFVERFRPYIGMAIPVLDWESIQNHRVGEFASWCVPWCQAVESATGVKPVIYIQQSYMRYFEGCVYALWVAQYASNDDVWGYQETPWNEGAYDCLIRQYTSCGRLNGWGGRLDLDKFYGTREDWTEMCGGSYEPSEDGIAVDGWWGRQTTAVLQKQLGCVVDGEIWHQVPVNVLTQPALTSGWQTDGTFEGSPCIRALQAHIGMPEEERDGLIGPVTVKALEGYLGTVQDGVLDGPSPTVMVMQKRLNDGTF